MDSETGETVSMPKKLGRNKLFTTPVVWGSPDLRASFQYFSRGSKFNVCYDKVSLKFLNCIANISYIPFFKDNGRICADLQYRGNGVVLKAVHTKYSWGIEEFWSETTLFRALNGVDISGGVLFMRHSEEKHKLGAVRIEFTRGAQSFISKASMLCRETSGSDRRL